ncbi:hypothetical protein JHK86_045692 [Glycine max]|nr:hypothetical protein JHK86_045692 [Glycine max]
MSGAKGKKKGARLLSIARRERDTFQKIAQLRNPAYSCSPQPHFLHTETSRNPLRLLALTTSLLASCLDKINTTHFKKSYIPVEFLVEKKRRCEERWKRRT